MQLPHYLAMLVRAEMHLAGVCRVIADGHPADGAHDTDLLVG